MSINTFLIKHNRYIIFTQLSQRSVPKKTNGTAKFAKDSRQPFKHETTNLPKKERKKIWHTPCTVSKLRGFWDPSSLLQWYLNSATPKLVTLGYLFMVMTWTPWLSCLVLNTVYIQSRSMLWSLWSVRKCVSKFHLSTSRLSY